MRSSIIAATVLIVSVGLAHAGIRADLSGDAVVDFATTMDMPFMAVGNPGNAADAEIMDDGTTGYGSVDYAYNIGKFEVTAGQYTEFLNAVAADDTYGVYNPNMWAHQRGCKIERTDVDSDGLWEYSVAADRADRPVNFLSWGDSARFANWLTNGMPTGGQDASTTEDGSYDLSGTQIYYGPGGALPAWGSPELAALNAELMDVTRKATARYVIPAEDEWYKAAYHANDPGAPGDYVDYPTSTDALPSNDLIDPDPGNNANFYQDGMTTIGGPYYRTEAGEFENSESPYHAFDMGGNVAEFNEALFPTWDHRGLRGGAYYDVFDGTLHASYRSTYSPSSRYYTIGRRVAEVPEPTTLLLMTAAGLAILRRRP